MNFCDVTVIIPNYNRTTLLQRALNSIKEQTLPPKEVIIVDDCSESSKFSEIQQIVQQLSRDLKITLLVNERNSGANHSRNRGIFSATSKYLAFLDSDDLWMPEKLERQIRQIEKAKVTNSRPALSGTGRYRVNADGNLIARQFGGKLLNAEKIRHANFIGTLSSIVVESWIAKHIHGFNELLSACQDWDFFIRLADYVQYVGIPEPLCIYVDHDEERITLNNKKRLKAHLFIYKNYIKNSMSLSRFSRSEFYRNIAEDYQALGNSRKAALYYAKHRSLRTSNFSYRLLPETFWFCLYRWRSAPLIKAERYSHYERMMQVTMTKPKERLQMEHDSTIIKQMMA